MPQLIVDPQDGTPPLTLDWVDGYAVQKAGPLGLGLPPRVLVERDRPDGHGTELLGVRVGPRDITIPLDVYATTRAEFLARRARLQVIAGRSNNLRPLRVTYVEDDGRREWVEGVYVGGLEGDESTGNDRSELYALKVRASRPYWHLPTITESWSLKRPKGRNWFPLLGRSPASSVVGGRQQMFVPSDVDLRPPWVIQGPGTGLLIRNHTANWEVIVDIDIPTDGPASAVTVTTEVGEQAIRDGYGNSLFGRITNGPEGGWEMGPLLPGVNDIEVRLEGSSSDSSSVLVAYDPLKLAV